VTTTPRAVLIVGTGCLATLAAAVVLWGVPPGDAAVREMLLGLASPAVIAAMKLANLGGDRIVLAPATILLVLLVPRARARWWLWVLLMFAAPLFEGLLKVAIGRVRPEGSGYAFPSGHATAAAAFCGAAIYLAGAIRSGALRAAVRALALASAVMVALARVVLRAHWPADALAGVALGFALAALAALIDVRASRAVASRSLGSPG
jgi:undecaprenyl-diphosphatase